MLLFNLCRSTQIYSMQLRKSGVHLYLDFRLFMAMSYENIFVLGTALEEEYSLNSFKTC